MLMGPTSDVDPPFRRALVAVCGECSGRDPRPKVVRSRLRAALKASGARRAVRVVRTSCLGLCPKRAVAVVIAPAGPSNGMTRHVVARDADLDRLTATVLDQADRRPGH